MGERPIIYIQIAAATEEDFVRGAGKQFRGDFFVAIDPPTAREIRVEARFSGGPIGVRADAIATPTTRNGAKGVLVRLVKLAPDSVAVPIWDPAAPPTPSPMSATLARSAPGSPAVSRTPTSAKHVVPAARGPSKHVISARPPTPAPVIEDPVEEFGAAITNTSSLSADIAKTLHDTVTPPRGIAAPEPKAHAKLVRRTPVAGVAVEPPKPVVKSVPVPAEPSIDEEWGFDAPTVRPTPVPKSDATKPSPPIASIGARAADTPPRGGPSFSPPRAPVLDDDAALDRAFDVLDDDDDLVIPVEKPIAAPSLAPGTPPKVPARLTPPSIPAVTPVDSKPAAASKQPAPKPSGATSSPSPRAASEPKPTSGAAGASSTASSRQPRAASEPKPTSGVVGASVAGPASESQPTSGVAGTSSGPSRQPRAASEPKPTSGSKSGTATPVASTSAPPVFPAKGAPATPTAKPHEPKPLPKPTSSPPATPAAKPHVASEPQPSGVESTSSADDLVATGGFDNTRPTSRTPREPLEEAAASAAGEARAVATSEIGPNERPTSVGLVASSRASTEAIEAPRSRMWIAALAVVGAIMVVIVVIVATRGGGSKPTAGSGSAVTRNAELDKVLAAAAARIQDGKLVGADGDTALDHLLKAKRLAPGNKQVLQQLNMLANTFEKLGDGAVAAGDLGEAATHFQAALSAEPERASAATKLEEVEDRARGGKK